jgi:hypothetical protein
VTELKELPADAEITPAGILPSQPEDDSLGPRDSALAETWLSGAPFRQHELAVPAENDVGFTDESSAKPTAGVRPGGRRSTNGCSKELAAPDERHFRCHHRNELNVSV